MAPPPELPCPPDPDDPAREVPLVETVALDEMLLFVLVFESTVALDPAVEAEASADSELTLDAALVFEVAAVVSADVEDVFEETPALEEGDNSEVAADADADAPAPDDDPAVLDIPAGEPLLVAEDWM